MMSETAAKTGWGRTPGWLKGLLAVSLSLNLAIAGLVGGNAIRHWHDASIAKAVEADHLDRRAAIILGMVAEDSRENARSILLEREGEISEARAALRETSMAFIEALRGDPLDPERLDKVLADRNAASARYWRIGSEQIVAIIQVLSAGERAEFADRLEERMSRWIEKDRRKLAD